jgi:hypothetical protein
VITAPDGMIPKPPHLTPQEHRQRYFEHWKKMGAQRRQRARTDLLWLCNEISGLQRY